MEMNFASRALGGTALGFGVAGTALNLLNGNGGGGLLGGLFGGCHGGVNHYELAQETELANRDMEIAYLRSRDAAKSDALELYKYVDGRLRGIEAQICNQAVVNAQITANISCMQTAIAGLQALTRTVIPIGNVCPEPMPALNSWTAPTTPAAAG